MKYTMNGRIRRIMKEGLNSRGTNPIKLVYKFDIYPERRNMFEEFCNMMSNQPDIFYGTNKEILK